MNIDIALEIVYLCSKKWSTDQVRPPSSYTSKLKLVQMRQYGDSVADNRKKCLPGSNNPKCYEEDHLISLEVGGHPTDPDNLWPEAYYTSVNGRTVGAKEKDLVEGFIHDEICFTIPDSRKNAKKIPSAQWSDSTAWAGDPREGLVRLLPAYG